MKKLFCALILMISFSAFANKEQTIRITSENISLIEVAPTVCQKTSHTVVSPALLILTLKDNRILTFKMITNNLPCSSQASELDQNAIALADNLDRIQHEDISTYERGNSVVCYKTVGLALWNKETNIASTFRTNILAVACPK